MLSYNIDNQNNEVLPSNNSLFLKNKKLSNLNIGKSGKNGTL